MLTSSYWLPGPDVVTTEVLQSPPANGEPGTRVSAPVLASILNAETAGGDMEFAVYANWPEGSTAIEKEFAVSAKGNGEPNSGASLPVAASTL